MSFFTAAFLGFIQGLTEFLPVSSSGHLSIIQNLLGIDLADGGLFFDVLLHLGTVAAVITAYRREVAALISELVKTVRVIAGKGAPEDAPPPTRRLLLLLITATVPLVIVPLYKDAVESLYGNTLFIGFALIITGVLLTVSDMFRRGRKTERTATVADAVIVGVSQALAVVPGLSRSGVTISVGTLAGFERNFAVKFSFLLSIPAVLGANLISLIGAVREGIDTSLIGVYLAGMVSAFVFGLLAISLIRYIVKKGKFGKFAIYCLAVGAVTVILSLIL